MHAPRFAHSRLAAYQVVKEALVRGDALARRLPRGYAKLAVLSDNYFSPLTTIRCPHF
jgi:hypothetical protein